MSRSSTWTASRPEKCTTPHCLACSQRIETALLCTPCLRYVDHAVDLSHILLRDEGCAPAVRAVNRRQWKTFRKLLHAVSMAVAAPSANDIHRSVWSRALCMPRLSPQPVNVLELDHKSNGASADFHRAAPALSKGGRVARPAMQLCGNHSRWPICGPAVRTSHGRKVHQRSAFVKRHSPQSALADQTSLPGHADVPVGHAVAPRAQGDPPALVEKQAGGTASYVMYLGRPSSVAILAEPVLGQKVDALFQIPAQTLGFRVWAFFLERLHP